MRKSEKKDFSRSALKPQHKAVPKTLSKSKIKWRKGYERLARVYISKGVCNIKNLRNFSYPSKTEFEPKVDWQDLSVSLSDLIGVSLCIAPFWGFGVAHIMLVFSTRNGQEIVVSPELRYRKGESFSIKAALSGKRQLCYVWGNASDLVYLRNSVRRGEKTTNVKLPLKKKLIKKLFKTVVKHSLQSNHGEKIKYHLLFNNCATAILRSFETIGMQLNSITRYLYVLFPNRFVSFSEELSKNT